MLKKTKEQINEKFAGREIHIIKAVNLLSDLDSINNLMNENASEWSNRQPAGEAKEEFEILQKNTTSIESEKKSLNEFIEKEMKAEFPNFSVLATPILGAKLLASAGSKKRLCFMPASTIQLLGAEKALFAHLRKNAKSPKHGHLFNHPLMQKLPRFKRGKAARAIAGKLSIALKQDYFEGEDTSEEVLKEMEAHIAQIDAQVATPKQEQKESEYEQMNADRRNEQFSKDNRKKEARAGQRSFTPEERAAYFEKQGGAQRPFQRREPFNARAGTGSETSYGGERAFTPNKHFKKRRPMINKNFGKEEDTYGEGSYKPQNRYQRRPFSTRRTSQGHGTRSFAPREGGGFGSRSGEGSYGARSFAPREGSAYGPRRSEGNYGERSHEGSGQSYGRTKSASFGKGRFNKPKHSQKRY